MRREKNVFLPAHPRGALTIRNVGPAGWTIFEQASPLSVDEAASILQWPSRFGTAIEKPPVKPRGGEVFLFNGNGIKTGEDKLLLTRITTQIENENSL